MQARQIISVVGFKGDTPTTKESRVTCDAVCFLVCKFNHCLIGNVLTKQNERQILTSCVCVCVCVGKRWGRGDFELCNKKKI